MRDDKRIVINPETAPIVKEIFKLYLQGKSAQKIADLMNVKYDFDFKRTFIESMVRNDTYTSNIFIGDEYVENAIPAILTPQEWELCQIQYKKNQEHQMRKETYIFMQKLKCPRCGRIMGCTHSIGSRGTKIFHYYQCARCGVRNINEESVEKVVIKEISEVIDYYLIADVASGYVDRDRNIINDLDINEYAALTEIEKRQSSEYNLRTIDTWNSLSLEEKQLIIMDFIDTIEINLVEKDSPNAKFKIREVTIKQINFKEEKIQNMAKLFKDWLNGYCN